MSESKEEYLNRQKFIDTYLRKPIDSAVKRARSLWPGEAIAVEDIETPDLETGRAFSLTLRINGELLTDMLTIPKEETFYMQMAIHYSIERFLNKEKPNV